MRRPLLLAVLPLAGCATPPPRPTVEVRVFVDESGHGYWRTSAYLVGWR